MINLLPETKGVGDEPVAKVRHMQNWHVEKSNPRNDANIPYGLVDVKSGEDVYEEKWLLNDPPKAEPNKRNREEVYSKSADPSPLSVLERGVADAATIAMPKYDEMSSMTSVHRMSSIRATNDELLISVSNLMSTSMDTYMQRAGSISTSVLQPNMQREHNLSQRVKVADSSKTKSSVPLSILLAPLERVCVTMSGKHEARDFHFSPGSIGMQIEVKFDRLICTHVLPASQAEIYKDSLMGAEIVAVNGLRVLNLEDFQESVVDANNFGKITITAVTFKEGKTIEHFYAQFMASKKATVKSLFSGLLSGGVDEDHQHGMELPTASNDDDEDDDDDEDENDDDTDEKKDEEITFREAKKSQDGPGAVDIGSETKGSDSEIEPADFKVEAKSTSVSRAETKDSEDDDGNAWYNASSESRDSDDSDDNITSIRKKPVFGSSKAAEKPSTPELKTTDDGDELMAGRAHRREGSDDIGDDDYPAEDQDEEEEEDGDEDEDYEEEDMLSEIKDITVERQQVDVEVDAWNFATALEVEEMVPFSRVVCVPSIFQRSLDWGMPEHHIQFINYSDNLIVRVCWVDEDGVLIPRATLSTSGTAKHLELTASSHTWCLVAKKTGDDSADSISERDLVGDVSHHKPTAMIFIRPNRESFVESNFVCMTWKPWQSIFATQKARPKRLPAHLLSDRAKLNDGINPDILISIMDDGVGGD